jgi:DNA helicase-2/ATP-dependent DNA helicase PcrA
VTIEGKLVASSTARGVGFTRGERVFHEKFGYGRVVEVDGNKLTVHFDKAGEKRVMDSFLTRAEEV